MRIAVYAGSFDPVTNGHLWIMQQASLLFDTLIVAIGENKAKDYTFSLEERFNFIQLSTIGYQNIEIAQYKDEFLVNYAKRMGAKFIVRGIRNSSDYEYEKIMHNVNLDLCPEISTIFLIPPRNFVEVSSSLIKGLVGPVGWEAVVKKYVPEVVLTRLCNMQNVQE